jgi:membrane-bound lytic murein transglycosylase D
MLRGIIFIFWIIAALTTPGFCQDKPLYAEYSGNIDGISAPIVSTAANEFAFEYYIELLDKQTPLELVFNDDVRSYIDLFLNQRRKELEISIQRAQLYFPLIEAILDKYDLPIELKYIAVIESGLNPFAKSPSGAVGLWQFLYNTCSLFDLKVDSYIDERRDPYKSTDAACRYLKYLFSTFNDWNLVLASYNGGPRDVRNAIQRSGGSTDYWNIRPYLSGQSQNYLPAFIAMNYLMENYKLHNIPTGKPAYSFSDTDTLHLNYGISFEQISAVLDISISDLEKLNPVYKKNYIPDLTEACILVLPSNLIPEYINAESRILGYCGEKINYNVLLANAGSTENRISLMHTVQPGEYYHKIALRYNCTVENIKAWNHLGEEVLIAGQSLEIWITDPLSAKE